MHTQNLYVTVTSPKIHFKGRQYIIRRPTLANIPMDKKMQDNFPTKCIRQLTEEEQNPKHHTKRKNTKLKKLIMPFCIESLSKFKESPSEAFQTFRFKSRFRKMNPNYFWIGGCVFLIYRQTHFSNSMNVFWILNMWQASGIADFKI